MVKEITLRREGESVVATLPREVTDRLRFGPGDRVFAIETEHGVLITRTDPSSLAAMEAFTQVRQQYQHTLRKLAE